MPAISKDRFRLIGFLPLIFFGVQFVHYWRFGGLGNLAWMCNVGNLLLAIGLFLYHKELIRATAIWTIPGLGIWFWYVWLTGSTAFSSTLAHVGGVIVGMFVLSRVRMDRIAWLYAFVWYLFMQVVSRVITSPEINANVAHHIQPGWENAFTSYWKFWLVMTIVVAAALWAIGMVLSRIWPCAVSEPEALAAGPLGASDGT
ncbi:MAG TPA: hypothetical protein VE961_04665 [Pyrinomonadaceae bacterium]|nr:hypothetical protein [Pyrinomonadaceae bacterium]